MKAPRCEPSPSEVLVARAQRGDRGALDRLLRRYEPRVRHRVRQRLGVHLRSQVESADVAQDVMVEVLRSLGHYHPRGDRSFFQWTRAVIENRLRNAFRSLQRDRVRPLPPSSVISEIDRRRAAAESSGEGVFAPDLIEQALVHLTGDEQGVVRLRLAKVPLEEVARRLGRSVPATSAFHGRAKAKLVKELHRLRQLPPLP